MISKEREAFLEKLHKSILQSSSNLETLLSDSSNYKKVQTGNNQFKYLRPNQHIPQNPEFSSSILENSERNIAYLQSLFSYRILFLERLYNAKTDGFSASAFHSKCDKKFPSLLLFQVKATNQIFGAFVSISWESPAVPKYRLDKRAFLFSFTKRTKHPVYKNEEYSVLMDPNTGPCFGGGCDLLIKDENQGHTSNLGFTFQLNESGEFDTIETRTYLAGDIYFSLENFELFYIEFHFK